MVTATDRFRLYRLRLQCQLSLDVVATSSISVYNYKVCARVYTVILLGIVTHIVRQITVIRINIKLHPISVYGV